MAYVTKYISQAISCVIIRLIIQEEWIIEEYTKINLILVWLIPPRAPITAEVKIAK